MNKSFDLNVLITTYNLEDYIEQTLMSVLEQETKYSYNIIILDDCSTDNTVNIIKRIRDTHAKGNLIELHEQSINKGVKENTYDLFKLVSAKYISFLDGDDWWIDKYKIEKQVSFLENNPEYNLCTGRHKKYFQKDGNYETARELININKELTLKDYLAFNFGMNSAHCFRNNFTVPDFFAKTYGNDQLQVILSVQDGKIKYFSDFFAVYRIHQKSNTHNIDNLKSYNDTKFFLENVDRYTNFKYHKQIKNRERINKSYLRWSNTQNFIKKTYYKLKMILLRLYAYKILAQ